MNEVLYSGMRQELIEYLGHLEDRDYQAKVWVNREYPTPNFYDDFSETYELLQDLGVLSDPQSRMGFILKNQDEVVALTALNKALDELFALHGTDLSDSEYLELPEWVNVISAAKVARQVIVAAEL